MCNNNGKCVDTNKCDCSGTKYKGLYCDEYYKIKRYKLIDAMIQIISVILNVLVIVATIGIIYYKKNPVIKAGKIFYY